MICKLTGDDCKYADKDGNCIGQSCRKGVSHETDRKINRKTTKDSKTKNQ